jgi:DNA-binding transcriptional LysR family regulator
MKKNELFNLDHLLSFKTVAEHGSITKASEVLAVSKSQVSRDLAELEKKLGTPVIYRTTRKVELTDAGRLLLERAAPLLEELFDISLELASSSEVLSGRIRLTAPLDIGHMLLSDVIEEFARLHPKVSFEIYLSQEHSDLVGKSIDLALRAGNVGKHSFKVRRVLELGMAVVAAPQFLSGRNLTSPDEIANEPCFAFAPFHEQSFTLTNEADERQKITLRFRRDIVCNDPQFMLRLAKQGKGMALLPALLCEESLESGALVRLLPKWTGPAAQLNLVFPSQRRIPKHVKAFADFLVKRVQAG